MWKVNSEKNTELPMEKFSSFELPRNGIVIQHFIILSSVYSIICQAVAYGRCKTTEDFKLLTLKTGRAHLRQAVAEKKF